MKKYCRIFSVFLCLVLLFSVVYSPVEVNAFAFFDVGQGGLFSIWQASGLATESAEHIAPVLDEIWGYISAPVQKILISYEENMQETFRPDRAMMLTFVDAVKQVMIDGCILGYKITHPSVDLKNEHLTTDDVIAADTELYMPTQEMLLQIETLTAQQMIVDYAKQQATLTKKTNSILQNMSYALQGFTDSFAKDFASFQTMVHSYLSASTDWLSTINNNLQARFSQISDQLSVINTNIVRKINLLTDWFPVINDNMQARFGQVSDLLVTINSNIKTYFGKTFDWLKSVKTAIETQGQQIVQKLDAIEQQLLVFPKYEEVEVITKPQVEVQVQDQVLIVTDYATMKDAFSLKLGWVTDIFDFLSELRSRLNSGTPPKVPIHLSKAEGSIDWGEDSYILDMSWYSRYKPSVDTIISGIMWLCFGWAIYKRIPDILSGVGISVENATQSAGHVWSDRAERSASMKYKADVRADYYKRRGG